MNKFRNKSGWLTPYALACGYVQQFELNEIRVTLWYEGGNCYQVRQHDFKEKGRIFWEAFTKLSDARKLYSKTVKEIKKTNKIS